MGVFDSFFTTFRHGVVLSISFSKIAMFWFELILTSYQDLCFLQTFSFSTYIFTLEKNWFCAMFILVCSMIFTDHRDILGDNLQLYRHLIFRKWHFTCIYIGKGTKIGYLGNKSKNHTFFAFWFGSIYFIILTYFQS